MRRRSVSSCVSPGPRMPMPPRNFSRWVHIRVRRGSMYSNCASSTCILASLDRALGAIHHALARRVLDVLPLRRCEFVVEDDERRFGLTNERPELLDLALA